MSVPNDLAVVTAVYSSGSYDLKTHEGQAAFVDAVVVALHMKDRRWGHLKKNPSQTNIHGHAEDAALYLSDTPGQSVAVDFIGGAGGPNPTLIWNPDQPRYSRADWFPPSEHGAGSTPPPAPTFPYPDEVLYGLQYQAMVKRAYNDAGRQFPDPNDSDAFRHFIRLGYSFRVMPPQEAIEKHIRELRQALGVSPV